MLHYTEGAVLLGGKPVESSATSFPEIKENQELRTEEGSPVNRVYPKNELDLFAGEQLVLVGRYKRPGVAKVIVQGKVGGKDQTLDFPATFVEKSNDDSFGFIEDGLVIRGWIRGAEVREGRNWFPIS